MDEVYLKALLEKYTSGNCTPEEIILLESWYISRSEEKNSTVTDTQELFDYHQIIWDDIREKTGVTQKTPQHHTYHLLMRLSAAASVILALSFGGYLLLHKKPTQQIAQTKPVKQDLTPGRNMAILILSNGKQVSLRTAQTGIIARQTNAIIQKNENGTISYKKDDQNSENQQLTYNTIKTEKGEQWPELVLSDGTKVILDAYSSITYPTSFNGDERKVTITGQVYFEVAHNSKKPFRVVAKGQTIEDIGTQFNVNAYDDEPSIKTTLVEGSISVTMKNHSIVLKPGQQAITRPGDNQILVKQADIDEAIDWKNGLFHFDHADLKSAMRQIARWYDVDVVYEGNTPQADINGEVYRNMNASKVFEVLNNLKVNLKIDGKKIIITNNRP